MPAQGSEAPFLRAAANPITNLNNKESRVKDWVRTSSVSGESTLKKKLLEAHHPDSKFLVCGLGVLRAVAWCWCWSTMFMVAFARSALRWAWLLVATPAA